MNSPGEPTPIATAAPPATATARTSGLTPSNSSVSTNHVAPASNVHPQTPPLPANKTVSRPATSNARTLTPGNSNPAGRGAHATNASNPQIPCFMPSNYDPAGTTPNDRTTASISLMYSRLSKYGAYEYPSTVTSRPRDASYVVRL